MDDSVSGNGVTELGESHRAAAVRTLAEAFADDPAMVYMVPGAGARARMLRLFFDEVYTEHLAHGLILGTADAGAVTLWRAPGKVHYDAPQTLAVLWRYFRIFGFALRRALPLGEQIKRHLPAGEDHYYLKYAAVSPPRQGKGLGGRLIRAGLSRARAAGVDTILETATPSNVGLYQALGFVTVEEWDVPKTGGPHFWNMAATRAA